MNEKDSNIHRSDAGTLLIISVFYAKIGLIFNPYPKRQEKSQIQLSRSFSILASSSASSSGRWTITPSLSIMNAQGN